MRITPLDIYQQEFKKVLRGFDPDEVSSFLERIADDYEQMIKENSDLKDKVKSMELQLSADDAREQAENIQTFVTKEEAEEIILEARKEAEEIIKKAVDEAREIKSEKLFDESVAREQALLLDEKKAKVNELDELIEKAKTEELELRREVSKLQSQKVRFLIEYRELLEKYLKILTEEWTA